MQGRAHPPGRVFQPVEGRPVPPGGLAGAQEDLPVGALQRGVEPRGPALRQLDERAQDSGSGLVHSAAAGLSQIVQMTHDERGRVEGDARPLVPEHANNNALTFLTCQEERAIVSPRSRRDGEEEDELKKDPLLVLFRNLGDLARQTLVRLSATTPAPEIERAPPVPDALRAMFARVALPCGHGVADLMDDTVCGACLADRAARAEGQQCVLEKLKDTRRMLATAESERMYFHGDAARERILRGTAQENYEREVRVSNELRHELNSIIAQHRALLDERSVVWEALGALRGKVSKATRPARTWWLCPGTGPGGRSPATCEGAGLLGKEGERCPNCGREKVEVGA